MEGAWRGGALALLGLAGVCLALVGCGDDGDDRGASAPPLTGGIVTESPEYTFAPIVYMHPDERYLPKSGKQFVSQSTLYFAQGPFCRPRRVAAGNRELVRLTEPPIYSMRPFTDTDCRRRSKRSYRSDEVTRPHENSDLRVSGLRPDEGFYLDLDDDARRGPPAGPGMDGQAEVHGAAAWHDKHREQVAGGPGMRITHWLLFGMHAPHDLRRRPLPDVTHEGDWERVDILLRGEGRRWKPIALRTYDSRGRATETRWGALRREKANFVAPDQDRGRVHPVLFAALDTHTLHTRPGSRVARETDMTGAPVRARDVSRGPCRNCPRMETALPGFSLESQYWYGFGGAWGDLGRTTLMTGPLGPRPG